MCVSLNLQVVASICFISKFRAAIKVLILVGVNIFKSLFPRTKEVTQLIHSDEVFPVIHLTFKIVYLPNLFI